MTSDVCLKCGGVIQEAGNTYGFTGKVCICPRINVPFSVIFELDPNYRDCEHSGARVPTKSFEERAGALVRKHLNEYFPAMQWDIVQALREVATEAKSEKRGELGENPSKNVIWPSFEERVIEALRDFDIARVSTRTGQSIFNIVCELLQQVADEAKQSIMNEARLVTTAEPVTFVNPKRFEKMSEDEIGMLCYRGNTVRYVYDKLTNYSNQLGAAGMMLRELGYEMKGSLKEGFRFERACEKRFEEGE